MTVFISLSLSLSLCVCVQRLCEVYSQVNCEDGPTQVNVESCNWFNLIVDFLFRELRDSEEASRSEQHDTMVPVRLMTFTRRLHLSLRRP